MLRLPKREDRHRCRGSRLSETAVSNILTLVESFWPLPGWPRNNAAHLEAASPGSG